MNPRPSASSQHGQVNSYNPPVKTAPHEAVPAVTRANRSPPSVRRIYADDLPHDI
jgi:hypothetical protein